MASFIANLFGLSPAASPSRGSETVVKASPPIPSYSFAQLQELYNKLSQFRESDLEKGAGDAVVETVRQITEALIWGEQNDTNFFDFFCEKSILADFIRVLGLLQAPKEVKVQLLQTLSMLVQNIRRQTSVYYLLSGNYVNKLIAIPLDFNDEEILAYYITLLKSLAMRLDNETIKFFFLQHPECSFPLYIEAAKFFSHRDQMVRAAVRTITLQVYRIDDKAMQHFVLRHARETYFNQLAGYLRDLWFLFNAAAVAANGEEDVAQLQHRNDLQQDLLIYLSDVFDLEVSELNEVLADRLLNGVILPVLLPSIALLSQPAGSVVSLGGESPVGGELFQPAVALFLLRQVFDTFHCRELIEPMALALLQQRVPSALANIGERAEAPARGGYPEAFTLKSLNFSNAHHHAHLVPNPLREHFLGCLRSTDDSVFLLAASVIQSCITKSTLVLPTEFLERVNILPGSETHKAPPSDISTAASSSVEKAAGATGEKEKSERKGSGFPWPRRSSKGGKSPVIAAEKEPASPTVAPPADESNNLELNEVLFLLLQGLQRASWQLEDFQVFVRILLDIFLDSDICHHPKSRAAIQEMLQWSVRNSALVVRRRMLQAAGNGPRPGVGAVAEDDSVLDVLLEEWELHKAPLGSVSDMCSNPRLLLPTASPTGVPGVTAMRDRRNSPSNEAERQGQKVVRSFLLLRRLLVDLATCMPQIPRERNHCNGLQPWANMAFYEQLPVQVDEEVACGLSDNMNIEVGPMERIVCSLSTAQGKQTRYFLLHDYWLLLVQPDLTMMGWAVVKTLWPIRSVQSLIDRSDPRTLRIGIHALRGSVGSGEAAVSRSSEIGGGERPGNYLTLTLNFEDVKRCHSADRHLQNRRQEVRGHLMQKAMVFIEEHCTEQLPQSLLAASPDLAGERRLHYF